MCGCDAGRYSEILSFLRVSVVPVDMHKTCLLPSLFLISIRKNDECDSTWLGPTRCPCLRDQGEREVLVHRKLSIDSCTPSFILLLFV